MTSHEYPRDNRSKGASHLISSHLIVPNSSLKYIDVHRQTDRQTDDDKSGGEQHRRQQRNSFRRLDRFQSFPISHGTTTEAAKDSRIELGWADSGEDPKPRTCFSGLPPTIFLHHGLGHDALGWLWVSNFVNPELVVDSVVADVLPFVTIPCSLGYIFNVGTPRLLCGF